MKTITALIMMLFSMSLSLANIIPQCTAIGIGYALLNNSIADNNYHGPAMIALGECFDCPGISFAGTTTYECLTILNSGIHINSCHLDALDVAGSITISLQYVNVVGGIDSRFYNPKNDLTSTYVHDNLGPDGILPDPYADVPDAFYNIIPDLGTISTSGTYSPGYYSGGIQVAGGNIVLLPGNYYLDSIGQVASMHVLGGLITGEGITLHIIGDADRGIDVVGSANIDISASTSGMYTGICIFQKRNPDYNGMLSCLDFPVSEFIITGNVNIDGAIYMPHNKLELGGTGDISAKRIIADRISIHGTSTKIVGYDNNSYTPGDLTKDGIVDFDDLVLFYSQWGADFALYREANLNYDINLNLEDFAIFASHWLEGI